MPPQPGELSLLTLFADIHYFFSPPATSPPHHRFDKSSYVYLYHNALQRRGRLEVANHAGTPEQDAFMGYMDSAHVDYSYKHPNLLTIMVNGGPGVSPSASPSPQRDISYWHLPALDPRNEGKYMYPLHTIDIYFWTHDDATMFLDSLKRFMPDSQLRLRDVPASHSEHRDSMSPVVQKLEKAAITNPFHGRSSSVSAASSAGQSFSGPPSAISPSSAASPPPVEAPSNYAPMAYNPAAPGAPEPIAHREKTPPPLDGESGTGLASAAVHEHGAHYGTSPVQHQPSYSQTPTHHQLYPPTQPARHPSFPPPPPSQAPPNTAPPYLAHPFAPPPQDPPAHLYNNTQTPTPAHPTLARPSTLPASHPIYPAHAHPPAAPPHAPYAPHSPAAAPASPLLPTPAYAPLHSPGFPPAHAPLASPGLPPQGAYGAYGYAPPPPPPQQGQGGEAYAVHQQSYRPTDAEAAHAGGKMGQGLGQGQQGGRFEQRVERVEKGVGRFLKRLDKKF